ncbi:MAG TPA: SMP-30/gluconolactonase/LRE family protein [Nannocystaceae bacterium]|nr:SMP-30/gluconolactonase/LRE family protein [Nannocystaceae bacterium]
MLRFSLVQRIVGVAAFAALACGDPSAADDRADGDGDGDGTSADDDGGGQVGHTTRRDSTDPNDDGDDSPTDVGADGATVSSTDGGESDDGSDGGDQDPLDGMGTVEMVGGGFGFAEGPVWSPQLGALLFTDIPADAILCFDPVTDDIVPFIQGTGAYTNGLDLDALGNLLMCEGGHRRVTRQPLHGSIAVLVETWSGTPFNAPNDIATHASGSIFFTDPTYGATADLGGSPPVLDFQGVYRIGPDDDVTLVDDTLEQPNGVVVSPDGATLYVADTPSRVVVAYPLDEDGVPGPGTPVFEVEGGGDGMTIDEDGNLYVASADGIEVWRGDGSDRWGTIPMPDVPTNCAFGGDDLRDLYVTLPTQLLRVRLAVPGIENAS